MSNLLEKLNRFKEKITKKNELAFLREKIENYQVQMKENVEFYNKTKEIHRIQTKHLCEEIDMYIKIKNLLKEDIDKKEQDIEELQKNVKDYEKKEDLLLEKIAQLELNNKLLKKENEKLMEKLEENV